MELTVVPLLLPAIKSYFGLSISEVAWVFNSYGISVALGVVMGGWLGDALNAKKVFLVGVFLFALGAAIAAVATSFGTILLGRIVQGFGGGVFSPLVPLLLTRASPKRPGKVLIVWGSITGYVAAFAPLIVGRGLVDFGWQFSFMLFAMVSALAMAIIAGPHIDDNRASTNQLASTFSALLGSRDLLLMFGYVFCTYGAITFFLFRLPLWMSERSYDVISISVVLSSVWLSFSIFSTILRNQIDGPFVRSIMLAAPILIAAGLPLAYMVDSVPLFASAVLIGCGLACSNAPSTHMILRLAPRGRSAFSASLDITFARLGGVTTVAWLANAHAERSILSVTILSLIAFLCVGLGFRKSDQRSPT